MVWLYEGGTKSNWALISLTAPVLVVHEGALFEGHCSMQPEGSQSSKVTVFAKDERVAVAGVQKQA